MIFFLLRSDFSSLWLWLWLWGGERSLFHLPETLASTNPLRRLGPSMFSQARKTRRCPLLPRLDGKLALVTGATGGIGLEIARGLAQRGAELVLPLRNPDKGERAIQDLLLSASAPIHSAVMDLEDLDSVREGCAAIEQAAAGRTFDILVENAGIWPQRFSTTRQGHEIAFGVNVLAHFALRQRLQAGGLLSRTRVVIVTGDIYILQSTCASDTRWSGPMGGMLAYCRSKLGNLWIAGELVRRFPDLTVHVAHPGVVASGLGGDFGSIGDRIRGSLMIATELGAQTPLLCATQDGLQNGGYYHNTLGHVLLSETDPARDAAAAESLWEHCEALVALRR